MIGTRIVKLLLGAVLVLLLAATAFFAGVYLLSERYLHDVAPGAAFATPIPADAQSIERGRHIARTRGCFGCHGQTLEGLVFDEEWGWVGVAVAPNLARYAREHEEATLEAAIRQGIGHDGRALWSMPSYNFALLADEDLAALIAYLRSAPVVDKSLPEPSLGWQARWLIASGEAQHMADWAKRMPPLALGADDDPQQVRGEYLAKTSCNECHGFDLRGWPEYDQTAPDLAILAAYSDQQFRHLMQTGEAIGGRADLKLMSTVARDRFASWTDEELEDLLAYLRTLPGTPVDRQAEWRALR